METLPARFLTVTSFASPSPSSSSTRSSKTYRRQSHSALAITLLLAMGTTVPGRAQNLSSLPAAVQAPVSAALGRDDSRYWPKASRGSLHAENPQHALAAKFTSHGVEIDSNTAHWQVTLRGYGYGNDLIRAGQAVPRASKNRVEHARGPLTEWYINGPLGLEQGFTLAKPPRKANGQPLTVALALSGNLTAAMDASGSSLTLKRPDGKAALRVSGLMAYDATGRTLQAQFALRGGELLLEADDTGAQYPVVLDPLVQQAELTASDGAADDHFGYSVAISGNGTTVLVGSPYHSVSGNSNQGAVYAFTFSGGTWTQQPDLTASDGAFGDYFGSSVSLSNDGNTALIGALGHTVSGSNQGAAYVFTYSSGNWAQQELTAADGAPEDAFGSSVSLSSDATTALIGAPAHNNQGAAYVFNLGGCDKCSAALVHGNWIQQPDLTASDGAVGDSFGQSVALGGDATALIGAPYHAVNSNSFQGAAYVFTLSGSWTQQQELSALDGTADDLFGSSVALTNAGTTALVGAPLATVNGNIYQGEAYTFTSSGSSWSQQQALTAGGGEEGFGNSVALAGNGTTALVGAPLATINGMSGQGAAYAFTFSGSNWTLQQELTAGDGAANDYFANAVALSGDGTTALSGALDHTVNSNSAQGAAYVWNTPNSQLTASPAILNFPNTGIHATHPMVVDIINAGPTSVTLGTASITPISGDLAAFSIREYCQPRTLKAGKHCVIGITFAPHVAGLSTATLNVPSNALGPTLEVPLNGTGIIRK